MIKLFKCSFSINSVYVFLLQKHEIEFIVTLSGCCVVLVREEICSILEDDW